MALVASISGVRRFRARDDSERRGRLQQFVKRILATWVRSVHHRVPLGPAQALELTLARPGSILSGSRSE